MKLGFKWKKQYRLPHYDYASDGYYFVTICTQDRRHFFGEIRNGIMGLNELGCMAAKFWQEIPMIFPNVQLDAWVVMPNHLHGILIIDNLLINSSVGTRRDIGVGTRRGAFLRVIGNQFGPLQPRSLASIINHFKGTMTKWCHNNGYPNFAWQSRYHERIIRDADELFTKQEYIKGNPKKWWRDRNNFYDSDRFSKTP